MTTARTSPLPAVVLLGVFVAAVAAGGWFLFHTPTPEPPPVEADEPDVAPDPPPPDPRVTFATDFRNVRPGVRYVGDAACAACHPAVTAAYRSHPMGRSAAWVGGGAGPVERYDAAAHNPCKVGPHELAVERDKGRVVHRVRTAVGDYVVPADLAIGSGTRGRSYLTLDHGAAWQSPVSWFTPDGGRWDLSPGFDLTGNGGRRPVIAGCLFCHVDRVEAVAGAVNRYREPVVAPEPSVGCERCHGPGSLHVAERAAGAAVGRDTSVVNPKHLSPDLRGAVCEQCHLQGQARVARRGRDLSEYRPGLPLELVVTVMVRHPDLVEARRSVGQVEQMEKSRCFTGSGGALGCVSCHDPHAVPAPAAKAAFFRGRCQTCHESRPCVAPAADRAARADSCVACHMPRGDSSNIVHASVTNHSVPRRPVADTPPRGIPPGTDPLLPFRSGPHAAAGVEADRAAGIALAELAGAAPATGRAALAASAADRLAETVRKWPGDTHARVARSIALGVAGRDPERLAEARAAVRGAPESESALAELTAAATAVGRTDVAEEAASTWARLTPSSVEPLLARGTARGLRGDWLGAEADARAALALNPIHPRPRLLLAAARQRQGDAAAARREADAALSLYTRPDARQAASDWYLQLIRR
ncbi:MAG: hypothetical protein U0804_16565 [Gemmataceae bacterium]